MRCRKMVMLIWLLKVVATEWNLHSLWAGQELYRKGNSEEEFMNILQKNMQPVYDSARRQGYEVWNRG